jgi:ribonucleoside-diphosphate reductase alpha chain
MKSMDGIIKTAAVIQKFTCQSLSTNLSYNPEHFADGEIPMSVLIGDLLKCNMYGLKTLYYHNTRDGREDEMVEVPKTSTITEAKNIAVDDEASCDACAI